MAEAFDPTAGLAVVERHGRDPQRLVSVLLDLQQQYGYLSRDVLELAAQQLSVPLARAMHVATFYQALSLEPRGRTIVKVCKGTACHVRGASVIEDQLADGLGIKPGQTTEDLGVTLESVACVGACAMAPVVVAGEQYVGEVTPAKARRLLKKLKNPEADEESGPAESLELPPTWSGPALASLEELDQRRKQAQAATAKVVDRVLVCAGTGCVAGGALKIYEALVAKAREAGLPVAVSLEECTEDHVKHVSPSGCHGFCQVGPLIHLQPADVLYTGVKLKDVDEIVEQTLVAGEVIERLLYLDPVTEEGRRNRSDIGFYKAQQRVALSGCGALDPESLDDYLAASGFEALAQALQRPGEELIDEVEASGLRGRGGAGFPTGRKWRACRQSQGEPRSLVCNGDEGDPGAFMDRSIMEGDPFRVIEGLLLGAHAVGAQRAFIYVRDEYPLAVQRVTRAVATCRGAGLLGTNILGTGLSFDIHVVRGGGAFVCGEETALLRSIEGWAGEPRQRPPFPAEQGLGGGPTLINNVETWATIAPIIRQGSAWFSELGTEGSKGTKVFSLVGKVRSTGLVEVPMGTTLRQLVEEVGGGVPAGRTFKAVQTGGPSGGCIPADQADIPVDFDKLQAMGSMMGSGGLIVMDDRTCMVDVARYFTDFLAHESCGKCMPCRDGLAHLREVLTRICSGQGQQSDLALLEEVAEMVGDCSLCGLGQTAANPVKSTLRFFRDEYEAHVLEGRCPAGVCRDLVTFRITEACTGCRTCAKLCPVQAISGERKQLHVIDGETCTRCGICQAACRDDAVVAE
jgi:NADH-quinone oxidoreductase subunit F